jgi:hypothetical protein
MRWRGPGVTRSSGSVQTSPTSTDADVVDPRPPTPVPPGRYPPGGGVGCTTLRLSLRRTFGASGGHSGVRPGWSGWLDTCDSIAAMPASMRSSRQCRATTCTPTGRPALPRSVVRAACDAWALLAGPVASLLRVGHGSPGFPRVNGRPSVVNSTDGVSTSGRCLARPGGTAGTAGPGVHRGVMPKRDEWLGVRSTVAHMRGGRVAIDRLPSGSFRARLMIDGQRYSGSFPTGLMLVCRRSRRRLPRLGAAVPRR